VQSIPFVKRHGACCGYLLVAALSGSPSRLDSMAGKIVGVSVQYTFRTEPILARVFIVQRMVIANIRVAHSRG